MQGKDTKPKEFDVAADVKIFVEAPKHLESVKKAVQKIAKVKQIKEEELGFGIKFLRVTLLLADSDGGMDQLEAKMMKIPNVSQVEVETVTRV